MDLKRARVVVPVESSYGAQKVYLHPGHVYVTDKPVDITTVVGSCVSVCLWDRTSKVAGMNHFVLPVPIGGPASLKHGELATESLIERLVKLGASVDKLRARVLGGSCVIEAFRNAGNDLGSKNAAVARRVLAHYRIPVVQEDVGGSTGRKLVFHTDDGSVLVKLL
jgi:chemotaxis protein CheD